MDIQNFDAVRLGQFPLSFDVQKECGHVEYAISAEFYAYPNDNGPCRIEFRRRGYYYRMFLFRWHDQSVPKEWDGIELIWSMDIRK